MTDRRRYQIGTNPYMDMDQPPTFQSQKLTYAVAANVNGIPVWRDAIRGEFFQLRTMVDARNRRDARQLMQRQKGLVGQVYQIKWDFEVYGDYLIQSVVPIPKRILFLVGGVRTADPNYVVESTWTMYPIRARFTEEEQFTVEGAQP